MLCKVVVAEMRVLFVGVMQGGNATVVFCQTLTVKGLLVCWGLVFLRAAVPEQHLTVVIIHSLRNESVPCPFAKQDTWLLL